VYKPDSCDGSRHKCLHWRHAEPQDSACCNKRPEARRLRTPEAAGNQPQRAGDVGQSFAYLDRIMLQIKLPTAMAPVVERCKPRLTVCSGMSNSFAKGTKVEVRSGSPAAAETGGELAYVL
jgi:hypothetical protein